MTNKTNKQLLGLSIAAILAIGIASAGSLALAETIPGSVDRDAVPEDVSASLVPINPAPFVQYNFGSESISLYWGVDTIILDTPQNNGISGFTVDVAPTAQFTTIVADAQFAAPTNPISFNGNLKGHAIAADGPFWDTFTADVSSDVTGGDVAATVTVDGSGVDCLTTLGIVFEEGSGQPSGYTANGVSLRDQASGVINVAGIPAGNIPVASYLYWNYMNETGTDNQIDINGNTVTAIHSGSDIAPCWPSFGNESNTFGYVADVTPYVSGNGAYTIDNLPVAEWQQGATLVVVHHPGVITCDAEENVCKTVLISQEIEDGIIEVNELVTYNVTVNAVNNLGQDILDAMLKDNFGGDVEIIPQANNVTETGVLVDPDCEVKLKGNTEKAQVRCDIGTFGAGQEAGFTADVQTDINPGQGKKDVPKREYTSCGIHDMNSGATLNGVLGNGTLVEFATGSVSVEVFENADLSGDCDGDGFSDGDERNIYGTDPFDPADQPTCDGINTNDICVDGDGTATANAGTFQVIWGDPLTSWPTGFDAEGIDMFDNDGTCTWTAGDDLHVEGAAYPTAIRNAIHDDYTAADGTVFLDPVVLDLNLSLTNQTQVDIDLETGTTFTGCLGVDPLLKFHDANFATNWDDGEDIILDVNGNGIFD